MKEYVDKSQASKYGKARGLKEGKSYSSIGWSFSQEQVEVLMNYARDKGYSPNLPMYIFNNHPRFWTIEDRTKWFATKGVKIVIPANHKVKRKCQDLLGKCTFKAVKP